MRKFVLGLAFIFSQIVFAQRPHTLHNITSNQNSLCRLGQVYETGFYFVDQTGSKVENFNLRANQVFQYGFVIASNSTDFNLLYSLTCIQRDGQFAASPKVSFIVGANGPADPNINTLNYYGGRGNWTTVPGVGENFEISFP